MNNIWWYIHAPDHLISFIEEIVRVMQSTIAGAPVEEM